MIGQFVNIWIGQHKRPYNPVSRIDEPGIVDFFVRDLREVNKTESFTHHLLSLRVRDRSCRKVKRLPWRVLKLSISTTGMEKWSGRTILPNSSNTSG
jgi:hypothetical protein